MCHCRPAVRTPCCGSFDCHQIANVTVLTCPWCRHNVKRTEEYVANTWDETFNWVNVKEKIKKDGIEYTRHYRTKDSKGTADEVPGHFSNEDGTPGVLCGECFGCSFSIRFGSYEVIAICMACGKEDVIYSG